MTDVVLQDFDQPTDNQKKVSVNLLLRTIFHGVCFLAWCTVLSWGLYIWISISQKHVENVILKDLKNLTPCFFTNWNYVFQTFFLGLSLFHDVLEWMDKQNSNLGSRLRYWRDVIFNGMVVPFTLFVTTMFWCVYAVDRELVFPKIYDEVVPWWFNHCVHTNITIMIIIETLLQARRKPTDEKVEMILICLIGVSYAIVYYTIYYFTGRWLYQVFGVMNWWQICLYQLLIWFSSYVFYKCHFPVNRLVHGSEDEAKPAKEVTEVKNFGTEARSDEQKNGVADTNGVADKNGVLDHDGVVDKHKNGLESNGKVVTDLKTPPFSTKSWSLKYRSIRNQFESSHL